MTSRLFSPLVGGLLLLIAALAAPTVAAPKEIPCEFPDADRIVAIGMVGGHFHEFRALLRELGLVDEQGDWMGGETHLVQLGNLYGPGPSLDESVRLLMKLEKQATAAGGMVHVLHGKSENMVLGSYLAPVNRGPHETGYLQYSGPDGEAKRKAVLDRFGEAFDRYAAGDPDIVRERSQFLEIINGQINAGGPEYLDLIAPGTEMGDWLRSRNVVIRIGDVVFCHAGLSEKYCERPLAEINEQFRRELRDNLIWMSPRVDMKGPLWWSEPLTTRDGEMRARIEWIMHTLGAKAMVIGQSPSPGAERRGRLYYVDSRLSETANVSPVAMEIVGSRFLFRQGPSVVDAGAPAPLPDEAPRKPPVPDEPAVEDEPKAGAGR